MNIYLQQISKDKSYLQNSTHTLFILGIVVRQIIVFVWNLYLCAFKSALDLKYFNYIYVYDLLVAFLT